MGDTSVAEDPSLASPCEKLRYYLECVCYVVDHDINKDPLIGTELNTIIESTDTRDDYELKVLLRACALLQPSVLLDRCFFVAPSLCQGYGNRFMERDEAVKCLDCVPKEGLGEILVGHKDGKQYSYRVTRVMVFKLAWLQRNFIEPITTLANHLEKNAPEGNSRERNVTKVQVKTDKSEKSAKQAKSCCIL